MEVNVMKTKSKSAKHCCYGTCNSDTRYRQREDMEDVFSIPFPKPITLKEKCEFWIVKLVDDQKKISMLTISKDVHM